MTVGSSRLLLLAGRLAVIGGIVGIVAGVVQTSIGSRIQDWSGNKDQPVALGLLTVALSASAIVVARALRPDNAPHGEDRSATNLPATTLWFVVVAVVCSSTVGRLWTIPGALLLAAAGVTFAACGWQRFRSVIATNWLRGLLGVLGGCELLMAVSAASVANVVAGLLAGLALIAAAMRAGSHTRAMITLLIVATLPFAVLTWWTIVTPLISVVGLVIGLAAVGRSRSPVGYERGALRQPHLMAPDGQLRSGAL